MPDVTLSKSERLNSRKTITGLFQKGSSLFTYPFKFVYTPVKPDSDVPVQILFSVSKRSFPRSVDRHRILRLMREAYRLNKHIIVPEDIDNSKKFAVGLIYVGKDLPEFKFLERKLISLLGRFKTN